MRSLMLIGIIVCLFLHFRKSDDVVVVKEDTLNTRLSALDKKFMARDLAEVEKVSPAINVSKSVEQDREVAMAQDDHENTDEEDLNQIPWDEIEEGWKTQLKDYLVTVAPERADEIFQAYLEEKKKYVERSDMSEAPPSAVEEAPADEDGSQAAGDSKSVDVEGIHEENLRDIFGEHYSHVRSLHDEYVESIQYLNRSTVRFTISL